MIRRRDLKHRLFSRHKVFLTQLFIVNIDYMMRSYYRVCLKCLFYNLHTFFCRRCVKFSISPSIVPRPGLPCAAILRLLGRPRSALHSVSPPDAPARRRHVSRRNFARHAFGAFASLCVPSGPFLFSKSFRTRVDALRVYRSAYAPGVARTDSYRHEPRRAAGSGHHPVGGLAVVGEARRGQADQAEVPLLRLRQVVHPAESQGPAHACPHGRAALRLRPLRRRLQPPRDAQGAPHHGGLPPQAAQGVRPAGQRSGRAGVGAPDVNGRAQVILASFCSCRFLNKTLDQFIVLFSSPIL